MLRSTALAISLIWLAGCQATTRYSCPPLVQYDDADRAALVVELVPTRDDGQIVRWLNDYIGLRDACRALED